MYIHICLLARLSCPRHFVQGESRIFSNDIYTVLYLLVAWCCWFRLFVFVVVVVVVVVGVVGIVGVVGAVCVLYYALPIYIYV